MLESFSFTNWKLINVAGLLKYRHTYIIIYSKLLTAQVKKELQGKIRSSNEVSDTDPVLKN